MIFKTLQLPYFIDIETSENNLSPEDNYIAITFSNEILENVKDTESCHSAVLFCDTYMPAHCAGAIVLSRIAAQMPCEAILGTRVSKVHDSKYQPFLQCIRHGLCDKEAY